MSTSTVHTTEAIAQTLVEKCRKGDFQSVIQEFYSTDIVSIESAGPGNSTEVKGLDAIAEKGKWWFDTYEVHSVDVQGPLVAENEFSVKFAFDTTHKQSGERSMMTEIAVYHVKDGKIIREQFFYGDC
jgi:ketosteroid isomerase-like protein